MMPCDRSADGPCFASLASHAIELKPRRNVLKSIHCDSYPTPRHTLARAVSHTLTRSLRLCANASWPLCVSLRVESHRTLVRAPPPCLQARSAPPSNRPPKRFLSTSKGRSNLALCPKKPAQSLLQNKACYKDQSTTPARSPAACDAERLRINGEVLLSLKPAYRACLPLLVDPPPPPASLLHLPLGASFSLRFLPLVTD